ncbi:MAG: rhodanese-like domain-containing protein [Pirellula sp.]|jgi:rhodanese-related sulfurtransferase|nr:sulfurtransferase [Planctomycetota bacterium]
MSKQHSPGFLKIVQEARANIQECSIDELKHKLDGATKPILIDVREESEYAQGHVPGSIHLSKGIIERDIESVIPDPDTEVYLLCGGGFRSALAADNLSKMGYSRVVSVDGGWRAWTAAGYPVSID